LAALSTIALLPAWSWLEARFHIEAVGHSGLLWRRRRTRIHRGIPLTPITERTSRAQSRLATVLAIVCLGSGTSIANGQVQEHAQHAPGAVDFRISCAQPAQVEFNRAIALLHHMTYPRARESFEQVATIDPRCAMAHWGIAMTLFQPLWPTRPGPAELRRGWEAVQTARALGLPTERERLFVDAAAAFFSEPESTDYWHRIRRWEQAMERASTAFSEDVEVAAFYALAHLAVAPADTVSPAHAERAAVRLLAVLERNPDHPGAMHYLVHANDVPGREHESPNIVRKYETTAPRNPHALHMPTHVYTRLGDWPAVIRGNLRAAEAALEHPAGDHGQFVWDEFAHAIEYLIYAHLQKGADDEAVRQLKRLHQTARLQPTFKTAFHLASTRARYALERRAWREAMSLAPREPASLDWDRYVWPEAVTWFARGLGAARQGKSQDARAAADRLGVLEAAASKSGEGLFARNIRILRLEVDAWLAQAERDTKSSVALMREAAALELATPKHAVTPGPTLPAYELLGDLLLEQAHPAEALAAYRRSLELYPRRFNSLLGAARGARASGDESGARTFYQGLLQVAAAGSRRSGLDEARTFVSRQR
jgi:tetratricopeptide (TPR) repeat protein